MVKGQRCSVIVLRARFSIAFSENRTGKSIDLDPSPRPGPLKFNLKHRQLQYVLVIPKRYYTGL